MESKSPEAASPSPATAGFAVQFREASSSAAADLSPAGAGSDDPIALDDSDAPDGLDVADPPLLFREATVQDAPAPLVFREAALAQQEQPPKKPLDLVEPAPLAFREAASASTKPKPIVFREAAPSPEPAPLAFREAAKSATEQPSVAFRESSSAAVPSPAPGSASAPGNDSSSVILVEEGSQKRGRDEDDDGTEAAAREAKRRKVDDKISGQEVLVATSAPLPRDTEDTEGVKAGGSAGAEAGGEGAPTATGESKGKIAFVAAKTDATLGEGAKGDRDAAPGIQGGGDGTKSVRDRAEVAAAGGLVRGAGTDQPPVPDGKTVEGGKGHAEQSKRDAAAGGAAGDGDGGDDDDGDGKAHGKDGTTSNAKDGKTSNAKDGTTSDAKDRTKEGAGPQEKASGSPAKATTGDGTPTAATQVEEAADYDSDEEEAPLDLAAMSAFEYEQVAKLNPAQLRRYEQYRRSDLKNAKIKKVLVSLNPSLTKASDQYIIAVKGLAKLFVGDVVEAAIEVKKKRGEKGALQPKHLREAYRRLRITGVIPSTSDKADSLS